MSSQLKSWSVWHRGRHVINAVEYRAPDLVIKTSEYFAGHMDGPRITDDGMQALTAGLRIRGANFDDFAAIGFRPFVSTRLVIREGYLGSGGVSGIEDEIEGFISRSSSDPTGSTGRANKSTSIEIALSYYRRSVNGKEKVLLIPGEGVRRINGIDTLNIVSLMVYLSSVPGGIDGIDFRSLTLSDLIGEGF
ncbi:hypothetical protein M976_02896 [Buttiauxella ferragutiae ATCC 51602]|uniref:Phage protein n=1 Tax=Buttiauxella ferragutiae ATCC 51602 TaxID=1354252 RepID=A0ABX2W7A4_9ENTR|nr:phage major tail tube protein [Buttiauxella ferragutiae]OAT26735.1 hypothetical protein M976_02896 [Buttiauxella ferragutiae ATCC 51602]